MAQSDLRVCLTDQFLTKIIRKGGRCFFLMEGRWQQHLWQDIGSNIYGSGGLTGETI